MKTLREVLVALRRGDAIPLYHFRNQRGDRIVAEKLYFQKGQWVLWEIACQSSLAFGLGCCNCNSHEPDEEQVISRAKALKLIKDYIEKHNQDEISRIEETAWLDELILGLEIKKASCTRPPTGKVANIDKMRRR